MMCARSPLLLPARSSPSASSSLNDSVIEEGGGGGGLYARTGFARVAAPCAGTKSGAPSTTNLPALRPPLAAAGAGAAAFAAHVDATMPPVYWWPPGSGVFNPVLWASSVVPPKYWAQMFLTRCVLTPYFFA